MQWFPECRLSRSGRRMNRFGPSTIWTVGPASCGQGTHGLCGRPDLSRHLRKPNRNVTNGNFPVWRRSFDGFNETDLAGCRHDRQTDHRVSRPVEGNRRGHVTPRRSVQPDHRGTVPHQSPCHVPDIRFCRRVWPSSLHPSTDIAPISRTAPRAPRDIWVNSWRHSRSFPRRRSSMPTLESVAASTSGRPDGTPGPIRLGPTPECTF